MKKNRGIAVVSLIVVIVLVGVAGFSIFSWVKTTKQAQADKEVAEQREQEFKTALDDAQQEAEDNAARVEELDEKLTKTEEAMKLAEEKAQQDAEEKAVMLAELENKLEEEATAKSEAEENSSRLAEEIASLEEHISEAKKREYALQGAMGGTITRINPQATKGLENVAMSLSSQKSGIEAIKQLLASSNGTIASAELQALVRTFEDGLIEAEKSTAGLRRDLISSGEFSSSSSVGQAVADLQQTTRKQRAILNSLKSILASSGETLDSGQIEGIIADLEASISELETRQASLDSTINDNINYDAGSGSSVDSRYEQTLKRAQSELISMKRQLASAVAETQAAVERQKELERLSIEIRYDIDYQARSFSYARRLHSMYDKVANPKEER